MNQIKFSFIICCYNSSKYLNETIESVLNQKYNNFEIIMIDDGSTDNTSEILNLYKKKYKNIKVYSNPNMGLAYSRNYAVKKSSFDWIVILDHDDVSLPNRLNTYLEIINNHQNIDLIFSDITYFNNNISYNRFEKIIENLNINPSNLNLSKKNGYINLIKYGCFIASSTVAFKKSSYFKTKGFDEKFKFITDYIFFLEISKLGNIFCFNKPLAKWRMHETQSSELDSSTYYYEMCKLYFKMYFDNNLDFKIKIKLIIRNISYILNFIIKKLKLS